MLGTAEIKVGQALEKEKKMKGKNLEKAKKRKEKEGAHPFSSGSMVVRPFKESMSSGKRCNVKKLSAKEFEKQLMSGSISFKEPLIIKHGLDEYGILKAKYNISSLRKVRNYY